MKMNFWSKSNADTVPREVVLSSMPDRFRLPLLSLYAGEPQRGKNGELFQHDPQSRIEAAQGMWMYSLCREIDPKETCEIGLGYGYSTIYILAAIHANGCGAHLAIDPYQAAYHEIGMSQAKTIGMEDAFRLIPEKSSLALTDLIRKERAFDFIYIDGGHRFDDALLDFVLAADLCKIGGYVVLDDMWMASIQRVASFIRKNRVDFSEIQTPVGNISVFKKISEDRRNWDSHVDF
ncbi:MAG: class I SAM-dependent methyltransferase [Terracidiphilus sp.]